MPRTIEVNLKIPRLTLRSPGEPDKVIDNSAVRFLKPVEVSEIPKPGTTLTLTIGDAETFEATVTRSDWDEEKELFTVSCSYAKRSIPASQYTALVNDAEWTMKPLL